MRAIVFPIVNYYGKDSELLFKQSNPINPKRWFEGDTNEERRSSE